MSRILYICVAFGLAGCDFTTERTPEEVKVKGNSATWTVETGGASNYAAFVSREKLPTGTELRIQIETVGTSGNLNLSFWDGGSRPLQTWNQEDLVATQVLSRRLPESSRYALDVGGSNFWEEPKARSDESDGTSLLSLESGWKLRVKLVRMPL